MNEKKIDSMTTLKQSQAFNNLPEGVFTITKGNRKTKNKPT